MCQGGHAAQVGHVVDAALAQPGAVGLHRLLREGPDLRGRQPLDRAVRNFAEEYMEGRRFAVDGAFHLMLVEDLLHALAKLTRDAVRLPDRKSTRLNSSH